MHLLLLRIYKARRGFRASMEIWTYGFRYAFYDSGDERAYRQIRHGPKKTHRIGEKRIKIGLIVGESAA